MNPPFRRDSTVRAAILMTGSTYLTYAMGLVVSALIARANGPDDFGRYSYLVWLSGALVIIANNGLNTTGIRFISEYLGRGDTASAHRVHRWLLLRQWAWMAGVTALFLMVMPVFRPAGWEGNLGYFATFVLISMFSKGFYLFDISMAKGYGRFGIEAATTVLMSTLNLVATIALVLIDTSLMAFLGLFTLIGIGHMVSSRILLKRAGLIPMSGALTSDNLTHVRSHLAWTIVLTIVAVLGNRSIETWLLNELVGPAEVGYFAIAAALTRGGVDLLSSGLTTVLMPVMAHAYGTNGIRGARAVLSEAVRYFQFLGFLLAGAGTLLAPVVVSLMYGSAYSPVVDILCVMLIVGGLMLSEGAIGAVLSTTDNQRLRAGLAGFSVTVQAVCSIALIPKFGLYGAVAAHAVSRTLVFVISLVVISRVMTLQLPWDKIGGLALSAGVSAAIAGGVPVVWQGSWGHIVASLLYALVFIMGTILLRSWSSKDVQQLAELTSRYPRLFAAVHPIIVRWAERLQRFETPPA